ncbi:hypothetical protein FLJC2902T_04080 [Flavobacterium limnosediminis JC2902]|uniref:HTH araC/xylS-type domain-containing protein n=1 Tax=Flavobacterium limnosediminis JC2902 TaxID=1341181 RepID=V6SUR6_9FLAO|nr:helix-turn-helix domain-containing protein [Flavobacterium limnosediminis]ESU29927.1 hypothetical protein FLJC2902T_04080 [Flavobacterium limnosediminis JC2902]
MKQLFDFFMISGVLLGIVFIIATQCSKNRNDKTIIYLDLFIAFLLLSNLQSFLFESVFTEAPFFIRRLLIPWYALILPAFYTFFMYYLKIEKKVPSYIKAALLIFTVEIIIRVMLFTHYFHQENSMFIGKYKQFEEIANTALMLFIFIKTLVVIFKYSDLYSPILAYDNLKWMKNFAFISGIVLLMWICAIILNFNDPITPKVWIYYPVRISSTALFYWLAYHGYYNYSLMIERIALRKEILADDKCKNNILPNNHFSDDKFLMIKKHIEKNKRYRDPYFSLDKLSTELMMSTSKLSQLINKESGHNFSDFINHLRVENAKKYLTDSNFSNYTIIAIGLECGFNSKSAFYTAFKKFTSVTPSEYKFQKGL